MLPYIHLFIHPSIHPFIYLSIFLILHHTPLCVDYAKTQSNYDRVNLSSTAAWCLFLSPRNFVSLYNIVLPFRVGGLIGAPVHLLWLGVHYDKCGPHAQTIPGNVLCTYILIFMCALTHCVWIWLTHALFVLLGMLGMHRFHVYAYAKQTQTV